MLCRRLWSKCRSFQRLVRFPPLLRVTRRLLTLHRLLVKPLVSGVKHANYKGYTTRAEGEAAFANALSAGVVEIVNVGSGTRTAVPPPGQPTDSRGGSNNNSPSASTASSHGSSGQRSLPSVRTPQLSSPRNVPNSASSSSRPARQDSGGSAPRTEDVEAENASMRVETNSNPASEVLRHANPTRRTVPASPRRRTTRATQTSPSSVSSPGGLSGQAFTSSSPPTGVTQVHSLILSPSGLDLQLDGSSTRTFASVQSAPGSPSRWRTPSTPATPSGSSRRNSNLSPRPMRASATSPGALGLSFEPSGHSPRADPRSPLTLPCRISSA